MKKVFLIILTMIVAAGCFNWQKDENQTVANSPVLKKDSRRETPVVDAVKMIENSVVNIRTEKFVPAAVKPHGDEVLHGENYYKDFFGHNRTYKTQSLGSGFIVKDDGIIITNYHVIEAASKIYVLLSDNSTYEAELIGGDNIIDIAILKIKNTNGRKFPVAKTGNSDDIMLGETVIAMGDPYGLSSSITTGVISAVKRIINMGLGYSLFIQTDALINPGNSGGPLVNLDGEVIGINSAMVQQAQGICFSIPINTALRIMPEILKNHTVKTGYMGISAQEVRDKDGIQLNIVKVEKDSNAEKIGLKVGDRILQINDTPVSTIMAMSNMLRSYPAGSSISIVVARGQKTLRGKILLIDHPDNYGISVLRDDYGLNLIEQNNFIVVTNTRYPEIIKNGDVLLAVNNQKVNDLDTLNTLVMNNLGRVIDLTIHRGGAIIKIKIQI